MSDTGNWATTYNEDEYCQEPITTPKLELSTLLDNELIEKPFSSLDISAWSPVVCSNNIESITKTRGRKIMFEYFTERQDENDCTSSAGFR